MQLNQNGTFGIKTNNKELIMEPNLLTSIIGIAIFATIMYFGFKYANGNWKVSESKKSDYLNWTNKHGKKVKKAIIIITIIYGISMLIQISSLI